MTTCRIHQCPKCEGAINPEHFVRESLTHEYVTFLWCDFCDYIIETLWRRTVSGLEEVFSLEALASDNPILFGKTIERMKNARVA